MAALWNRAGHYVFALWFLLLSFAYRAYFSLTVAYVAVHAEFQSRFEWMYMETILRWFFVS